MSYTHTPSASSLAVYDDNENVPTEAPPSYDEALSDPQIDSQSLPQKPQRPPHPPANRPEKTSTNFQRPPQPPPSHNTPQQQQQQQQQRPPMKLKLRPATVINPNPYLPWEYPSDVKQCKKCANKGFKLKNGHPCKDCWKKYRRGIMPPSSQKELEYLVKNPPPPKRLNPNVTQLPPGVTMLPPVLPPGQMGPTVVKPGDPRIGGVLCPRCGGKGMVHFFLDLDTCPVCRGMGRVNSNGRPL